MKTEKNLIFAVGLMLLSTAYAQNVPLISTSPCQTVLGSTKPTIYNAIGMRARDLRKNYEINSVLQKYSSFVTFQPNTLRGYLSNNGLIFADSGSAGTGTEGLFWPASTEKNLVFTSGLWMAGKDETGRVRSMVSDYVTNYQPGNINGAFVDTNYSIAGYPNDNKFKMLILSDTSAAADEEYQRWMNDASLTGAPLNKDGTPKLVGNLNAYWMMNDLDTKIKNEINPSSPPMGLEAHSYIFGFDTSGVLSDAVFILLNVINKSVHTYDSTYFGWFSDIDLGDASDDLPACDTLLSLGYMYNGRDTDRVYDIPPACGFVILESPAASASGAKMTSFMKDVSAGNSWRLPWLGDSLFSRKALLVLSGTRQEGYHLTSRNDPGHVITYVDPGDPVTGTGWLATAEQAYTDNRILLGSGPFTFGPGETKTFVAAFIAVQDTSRFSSITKLRQAVPTIVAKWNAVKSALVNVNETKPILPTEFSMSEGFPNPFNPSTTFRTVLPERCRVIVKVYDVLGSEVRHLMIGEYDGGMYQVVWDGKNGKGQICSSGVYYAVVRATPVTEGKAGFIATRKVVLMK